MKRPRPKAGALQPLAAVMEQVLQQAGLGHVTLLGRLQQQWQTISGPQIAAVTYPEGMRGQVLFVTVSDAIWLQQLTFFQAQMLRNIRQALGDVSLTRIHFTLATSSRPLASDDEVRPEPQRQLLTKEDEQQVLEGTAHIADADLREAVRQAWRRGWEAKR